MKLLVVDADGLLVGDYRAVPNCDPIIEGLAFYNRLRNFESVLMLTRADRTLFHQWALPFNIERTWLITPEDSHEPVEAALGFAGRQHSSVTFYVTANARDAHRASQRGLSAALFIPPVEANLMAITPATGWSSSGYEPVAETPDDEDEL